MTGPRGRWVALAASAALGGVGALLIPLIQIGDPNSASRILATDSEFNRSHRAVQDKFGGSEPFVVIVEGDAPRALYRPALLRAMERLPALSRAPAGRRLQHLARRHHERHARALQRARAEVGRDPVDRARGGGDVLHLLGVHPAQHERAILHARLPDRPDDVLLPRSRRAHGAQRRGRRRATSSPSIPSRARTSASRAG